MNPETRPRFLRCTADGKRFLMTRNSEASERVSAPVTVVLNWTAGLKNRRDVTVKDQPATRLRGIFLGAEVSSSSCVRI